MTSVAISVPVHSQGSFSSFRIEGGILSLNDKRPANLDGLRKNLRQRDDGRWYWHWDPAYITSRSHEAGSLGDRMESAAQRVNCPTLLVRGARSELVDAEGVRHLLKFIAHGEAVDVGGAHHMVAGDQNDAFNIVIEEFLGRHLRPAFQGA